NFICEIERINHSINVDSLTPLMNSYRVISYEKTPIIFRELEFKMGREKLIKVFRNLFINSLAKNEPFQIEDIIPNINDSELKEEFLKYMYGQEIFPDFYINGVTNNSVEIVGDNISFKELVPIEVITSKGIVINDTLMFTSTKSVVSKQYDDTIYKVTIDKDFIINQSLAINDVWINSDINIKDSKYPNFYNDWAYNIASELISFVFNDEESGLNNFNQKDKELLTKAKDKLKNLNPNGYNLYINGNENLFRLYLSYLAKGKPQLGYIDGILKKEDNSIIIDRIKI
ncbi:MAG: hypothetical protein KDC67_16325, partial [Ignavibacteriae bacterium]|nr:hypothetical protein [Ignavibacteriota bacterium]